MTYCEAERQLPAATFDVVVAGGGTAGVVAAIAAARTGAATVLIESKGYPGGLVVEGGTALHSFFNLWKPFGVPKRQVVKGIAQEIVERLQARGGCSGHVEVELGWDQDGVCTCVDTELYKLTVFEMLEEAGVTVWVNTRLVDAIVQGDTLQGVIVESRSGREAVLAKSFIDTTGYGDLCARAGARYTIPNDYAVVNSIGVAGVSMEGLRDFLQCHHALRDYCHEEGRLFRVGAVEANLPQTLRDEVKALGMTIMATSVHPDYFMFIKFNYKMEGLPTNRDAMAKAELELRRRQEKGIAWIRAHIDGCQKAFITRTSPEICIRRGRCILCDYELTNEDILQARHFADDVLAYGYHDLAPRLQIQGGGTYGIPYRALCVAGVQNLYTAGMTITSNHAAHMSTRNTVSCMAQGQAVGTAAALCARRGCSSRQLPYEVLRAQLLADGVYLEN